MSLQHTRQLVRCFFMGIASDIPADIIQKRRENWQQLSLSRKKQLIAKIDDRSRLRRVSIGETATRNNYIFAGLAFITAASTNITLSPSTHPIARIVLQIGAPIVLVSTIILLIAIAAKGKVMQKQIHDFSEADENLEREVDAQDHDEKNPKMALLHDYETVAFRLHKRKQILLVERRAQWIATYLAVLGLVLMVIGFSSR